MSTHDQTISWTDQGDRRLQAAKAPNGSPLQLTHMALGNAATPIPAIKQATQVRNEVYRAPIDRVAVDTAKKSVVCELIVPENKKDEEIREIGVFEHDTLVAVAYFSSPHQPVQQESGIWAYVVPILLKDISASVIETVDNLDSRYLNASDNLKDLINLVQARQNLGLGDAATRIVGREDNQLVTAADALIGRGEVIDVDKVFDWNTLTQPGVYYSYGTSNNKSAQKPTGFPEGLTNVAGQLVVLQDSLGTQTSQLFLSRADSIYYRNKWHNSTEWQPWQKIVTDKNYIGLFKSLIDDETKRKELGLGTAALKDAGTGNTDLITTGDADSRYLNASENLSDVPNKATARTNLGLGAAALKSVGTNSADLITMSDADSRYLRASENQFSMLTKATLNAEALYQIVKSESVCQALETQFQSHRSTVHNILNAASSSLFTKQSGVTIGSGQGSWDPGRNTATIYIPTECNDDNDTDYTVSSLLSGNPLVFITKHSGITNVTTGIALRGVQVRGVGSSVGNVVFDVFTAVNNATITTPLTDNTLKNIFSESYGYQKFPSGLIIQWLQFSTISNNLSIIWPITFPTACLSVHGTFSSNLCTINGHWQCLAIKDFTKQGAKIGYTYAEGHYGSDSVCILSIGH